MVSLSRLGCGTQRSNGRLPNGSLIAREVADVFCIGFLVRIARWRVLADDFRLGNVGG
jgi:hypothetical protein